MKKIVLFLSLTAFVSGALAAAETVPCTLTIDSQEAFDQWTSIDANGDGEPYKFVYSDTKGCALYTENKSKQANEWIISPAVALEAGVTYSVTFSVQNLSTYPSDTQSFKFCAGQSPEVAAMTEFQSFSGEKKTTWPVDRTGEFTPTESGHYNFGINLVSSSYQGNFGVFSLKVAKAAIKPGAVTGLTITAAPEGELAATLTWTWPSASSAGGVLNSITGAKIYRGTSSYSTTLIQTLETDATPGTEGSFTDTSVPSSGKYYYKVVPFNADGESPSTASTMLSPYIGMATGVSISNVTATAVEGSETSVSLTWDGPTATGEGYFNPESVAYKITRSKDGATAETIADNWQGELPYIDSTINGLGSYIYKVYTIFNGSTSFSSYQSNNVVTGGALTLPYSNNFSSSSSADLFTFFHGEGATRDWSRSSSKYALMYWGSPADAWAVTPQFALEAGKAYQVSFTTRVSTASSPKNLAVAIGTAAEAEALTDVIFNETVSSATSTLKQAVFSVGTTGYYCIGFHCFGPSDSNDIYVDDLTVEEIETAPLSVSDATAEAAANGELKAIVSWTNPSKTNAGGDLTAIDRVVVSLDGTEVATVSDVEPGSHSSAEVTVDAPGAYTFAITAYVADNASEALSVSSPWIGFDTPQAPAEVSCIIGDEGERIISFSSVSEGIHGGYIDVENLRYEIKRNDVTLTSDQTDSPYVDHEEINGLGVYTYSVAAINGELTGAATSSEAVTLGNALSLPYTPSFASADDFALWTLNSWKYSSSDKGLQNSAYNSWAFTPPINMLKGVCKVTFRARCFSYRYAEDMKLYLCGSAGATLPENATLIGEQHIENAGTSNALTMEFNVTKNGKYHVAVGQDKSAMYLYLTEFAVEQVSVDPSAGIKEISGGDSSNTVLYFDLQGRRLERPAPGKVVIVNRNGSMSKELYQGK